MTPGSLGMDDTSSEQRRQLVRLAFALVLSMSTWFSTAAVLGQLRDVWSLSTAQASWLMIVVQIGSSKKETLKLSPTQPGHVQRLVSVHRTSLPV